MLKEVLRRMLVFQEAVFWREICGTVVSTSIQTVVPRASRESL
jgi:hypothetical protein